MDYKIDAEIQTIKQRFEIVGLSPLLNNAIRVAIQVAPTDMSVLIQGESGAGKESFFQKSYTAFPIVNMANLSPSIAEPYPRAPLIPNFLVTRRALSQAPLTCAKGTSK